MVFDIGVMLAISVRSIFSESMSNPVLYSTNPWLAHDISMKYRSGVHFVWCSDYFDPKSAAATSATALIAPSSSPKSIYDKLFEDWHGEEGSSALIKGYKKTFLRLAKGWLSAGEISQVSHDEIVAVVKSNSWRIWRPVLYVIPRKEIEAAGRLKSVTRNSRSGHGPELQIHDLNRDEFDLIETRP